MSGLHPVAAAGFAKGAEVYERARPSYPDDAVDWIVERAGLGPGRVVVDVGAGTGKLTRLLVPTTARVIAVEPVAEMRAKLVETTPEAETLDGTAESLPLENASTDAVTVATAFHWFDHDAALAELHRVLRPGGVIVLIWNMRDLDDPLQAGIEDLLRPLRGSVATQLKGTWRGALERSPYFGEGEQAGFRFDQPSTAENVCDRVASTSFVAAMPPEAREELLERVRALVGRRSEPFPFRYRTEVHLFPRSSDRGGREPGTSIEG